MYFLLKRVMFIRILFLPCLFHGKRIPISDDFRSFGCGMQGRPNQHSLFAFVRTVSSWGSPKSRPSTISVVPKLVMKMILVAVRNQVTGRFMIQSEKSSKKNSCKTPLNKAMGESCSGTVYQLSPQNSCVCVQLHTCTVKSRSKCTWRI